MQSFIEFITSNKPATPLQAAVVVVAFVVMMCFSLSLVVFSTRDKSAKGKEALP